MGHERRQANGRLALAEPDGPAWRLGPAWVRAAGQAVQERALGVALLTGLLLLLLAYASPRSLLVDVGGPYDAPHTPGFNAPEQGGDARFRWSGAQSALWFPGLGKPLGGLTITLQASSGRGAGSAPVEVAVAANGHPLPPLRLTPASEAYAIAIDPDWINPSGDLRLDFQSPTFRPRGDSRDLGFTLDFVRLEFPHGGVMPALPTVVLLLFCATLGYILVRAAWGSRYLAGGIALGFLAACAGVITVQRLWLTVFTTQLLVTLAVAVVVVPVAEIVARAVCRMAGWRGAGAVPEWAWAGLRGLVALGVVIKVGGLLYPHTFVVDAYFHLKNVTYMSEFLSGARPWGDWETYFGKNLALSVMPKDEWGSARVFIPYSPFFYVVAGPLAWLPVPLEVSVPAVAGLFEALKVPAVFLIGLALGRGVRGQGSGVRGRGTRDEGRGTKDEGQVGAAARVGLAAAAVYSFIPATYLLQQFGNWPTQTSLWLVTAWVALTTLCWERITRPGPWLATTAVLTLALLSYTVFVVYTGVFIGLAVLAGWLFTRGQWRRWGALALSGIVAALGALAIYYGRYVELILSETLPTLGQAAETQGSLTTLRPTLEVFLRDFLAQAMQSYNLILIYALGLAGTIWAFSRQRADGPALWQRVWLGAWLAVFPLFLVADFWVDQAFKEFWFALPAVAVVAGAWLLGLKARGGRLLPAFAAVIAAALVWQSLALWVFRLLFHNR